MGHANVTPQQCVVFDCDELVNSCAAKCFIMREGMKENVQPVPLFVEIVYPGTSPTGVMYMG